jgi:MYXO-CTERM domain-containing protein
MKTIAFLAIAGLAAGASAQSYSDNTATNADGSWDRPVGAGPSISGLGPVDYDLQAFFVDTTSTYDLTSVQDGWDGYLHLYEGDFNPLDQLAGLLAGDDDGAGGIGTSDILGQSLTANTQYFLVTSGFAAGDAGFFTNTVSGDGTATFGLVPAPGALGLLGVAGLVAARRRR